MPDRVIASVTPSSAGAPPDPASAGVRRGGGPIEGLLLVIADKPDVERDAVAAAWSAAGGEVVRLGRFWDPPPIVASRARLYGAETFCQVVAQKLGLELVTPPDDLMLRLPTAVTKRAVQRATLAGLDAMTFPAFVKSMIPKLIRSRVYQTADDVRAEARGLDPDAELVTSEVVELVVEARGWVLDGEVLAFACYEGDGDTTEARALATAIAALPVVPSPCVIDVGLTRDRGWVVIEANAAWGAGLNGCDPVAAARCIASATTTRVPERR